MNITDVPGQEHAKRAIEVAVAGRHSICFVGFPDGTASTLATFTTSVSAGRLHAESIYPCKCGWYSHPMRECTCTLKSLRKYYTRLSRLPFSIYVEIPTTEWYKVQSHLAGRRGEPWHKIQGRINAMENHEDAALDSTCKSLLGAAVKQLWLDWDATWRTILVGRTIANLAHSERIQAAHLAEAIQYRMGWPNFLGVEK